MSILSWSAIPDERLNDLASRRVIHTPGLTIARLTLRQSAVVPVHSHHNEQVTTLESGVLKFILGGEEHILRAGDVLCVPPHVPHSVEALEDCVAVDVFAPAREDWIRGDDAYLRR